MTMKISRKGGVVFLEGVVDENADFSPLLSENPPLQLDLSGVSRINSIGVRSWMKFISLWGDKPMEYLECPTIITDRF
jgi:anti-anti-sigma regulatory factor